VRSIMKKIILSVMMAILADSYLSAMPQQPVVPAVQPAVINLAGQDQAAAQAQPNHNQVAQQQPHVAVQPVPAQAVRNNRSLLKRLLVRACSTTLALSSIALLADHIYKSIVYSEDITAGQHVAQGITEILLALGSAALKPWR
jgi:hypothetical protein